MIWLEFLIGLTKSCWHFLGRATGKHIFRFVSANIGFSSSYVGRSARRVIPNMKFLTYSASAGSKSPPTCKERVSFDTAPAPIQAIGPKWAVTQRSIIYFLGLELLTRGGLANVHIQLAETVHTDQKLESSQRCSDTNIEVNVELSYSIPYTYRCLINQLAVV